MDAELYQRSGKIAAMPSEPSSRLPVVGLSGNVLDPRFQHGRQDGIGVYTQALMRALREQGVDVRRIGAPMWERHRLARPGSADAAFRAPLEWSMTATALTGMATPFARGVENAIDVYHATDYRIPRLSRTPVVATLYDAIPLAHPEWASPRLRGAKNWLLRSGAASADLVIAISHAAVDEIVTHYRVPRERIRVVPLGVDPFWFASPPENERAARAHSPTIRSGSFLFVGTLQPRKNIAALIAAHAGLPEPVRARHPLVIAGKYGWGVEALRSTLEAGRGGDIIWLDYVSREELRELYAGACAFVFPSLAEGFGLPVLEALAAGTPIIASDLPALREVAGSEAAFVPAGDVDGLSAEMLRVAESVRDPSEVLRRQMQARKFDWAACALGTLAAYREIGAIQHRRAYGG
jgi:alpha-1,3-rhamnosyl/mannosyltransferase